MILTCENCHARYLVPSHALGGGGRKVRCANCGHQWYQPADDELPEIIFADAEAIDAPVEEVEDPIPESVRPLPHSDMPHSDLPGIAATGSAAAALVSATAGALLTLAVVAGLFMAARPEIARAWPASTMLYDLIGAPTPVTGEGLVFERVSAELNGKKLSVEGRMVNQKSRAVGVPTMILTVYDGNDAEMARWLAQPDIDSLKGQAVRAFRTEKTLDLAKKPSHIKVGLRLQ